MCREWATRNRACEKNWRCVFAIARDAMRISEKFNNTLFFNTL
jgi:hypothetical protein